MGYLTPIRVTDAAGHRWTGALRPDMAALRPILEGLAHMDVGAALDDELSRELAWQDAFPPGVTVLEVLGPRSLHIAPNPKSASELPELVVKLVPPSEPRGIERTWRPFLSSRARRAHQMAHRLRAVGVATPRPIGFLERAHRPGGQPSFYVTEHVPAASLRSFVLNRRFGAGVEGQRAKRRLLVRVGELIRRMHAHGVFHGDLHTENLLVDDHHVWVIDLESVRVVGHPGTLCARGLERLDRDFAGSQLITRADRMRFLCGYLRHRPAASASRRALWLSVRKLAERRRVATFS